MRGLTGSGRRRFARRATRRPGLGWVGLALALVTVPCISTCKRGATSACREDVDCPAGFDCVGTSCARRERLRFGEARAPAIAPVPPTPPPDDAQPPTELDAARPLPTPVATPPAKGPAPTPPAPPAEQPGPQPRLPMWKERLKNS